MARDQQLMGGSLFTLVLLGVACQSALSLAVCREEPGCPAAGRADLALALPCEGNCRSYASCQDGKWEKKTCFWPWTRFSPVKKTCVLQYEVDCDWWKAEISSDSSEEDSGETTDSPKSICPATGSALVPDATPGKCQHYFSCENGKATPEICKPWENFDPISLKCELWDLVDCTWSDPTTVEPPTTETSAAPTTTTEEPTTTPEPPCEFTPACPASGQSILADPCRCQAYFECNDGTATAKLCKAWENFDPNLQECIWWSDVDCTWSKHTSPAPSTETTKPTTQTSAPETETPTVATETPAPETETPTAATETPAPETETPTEATETPAPETETPTEATETPAPETETPT
ncbi:hypothetical protein FOCC_FOCC013088, partial [Frankliniella occidentalis]